MRVYLMQLAAIALLLSGCMATSSNKTQTDSITGRYVSDGYAKRKQGYDWVAVAVTPSTAKNRVNIRIYSRADIKKPTCQFTGTAAAIGANQYLADDQNTKIIFNFNHDTLSISAGKNTNHHALMYYCSGGSSIAGEYKRLLP